MVSHSAPGTGPGAGLKLWAICRAVDKRLSRRRRRRIVSHAPATGMLLRLSPQMTAGPDIIDNISLRARMTYLAHLYKACMKQHHRPLMPALRRVVPEDAVVLDCGAHAGQFTKLFAAMAPKGHIYAVEPGSYAFSILRRAVAFNRLGNVTVKRLGLSDSDSNSMTPIFKPVPGRRSLPTLFLIQPNRA